MAKVSAASGAKYSHEQSDLTHVKKHLVDDGVVAPVGSGYTRPEIIRASSNPVLDTKDDAAQIRKEREDSERLIVEREKAAQKERDRLETSQLNDLELARKEREKEAEKERLAQIERDRKEREAAAQRHVDSEVLARVPDVVAT